MPKTICSCSMGKDSLATVILALMHHEPLDEIVYCEVMFDKEISGEVPEHRTFIYETAIPWLRRAGLNVKILRANTTYKECFTKTIQRGKGKGKLKGFPLCGRCNIQRDCKVRPIQKYMKSLPQDTQQYVGLATDEQDRLMRLQEKQISLLEQYACSESEAWELCHRYGLLSPVYDFTDRNGCWFCPNAKLPELRHLYDHHPDLWREMLALQALPNKATEKFNRELRFSDYDMARRICERRKQLRLTQEELAEMSDMTTQAVSYAESGKRAMRPDSLRKLAAALCVSADYLLTGDIVDKDLLILADKLRQLTPSQIHTIESIIDECIQLYSEQ